MGKGVCLVLFIPSALCQQPQEILSFGIRESGSVGLKITQHWSHLCKMEKLVDQP